MRYVIPGFITNVHYSQLNEHGKQERGWCGEVSH